MLAFGTSHPPHTHIHTRVFDRLILGVIRPLPDSEAQGVRNMLPAHPRKGEWHKHWMYVRCAPAVIYILKTLTEGILSSLLA